MRIIKYIFIILIAELSCNLVYAGEQRITINITENSLKHFCLFANELYSEGSVYKTSDNSKYICSNMPGEQKNTSKLVWKKIDNKKK